MAISLLAQAHLQSGLLISIHSTPSRHCSDSEPCCKNPIFTPIIHIKSSREAVSFSFEMFLFFNLFCPNFHACTLCFSLQSTLVFLKEKPVDWLWSRVTQGERDREGAQIPELYFRPTESQYSP